MTPDDVKTVSNRVLASWDEHFTPYYYDLARKILARKIREQLRRPRKHRQGEYLRWNNSEERDRIRAEAGTIIETLQEIGDEFGLYPEGFRHYLGCCSPERGWR